MQLVVFCRLQLVTSGGPSMAGVPAWTATAFNSTGPVNSTVAYNLPVVPNTGAVKIYNATRETGVYSHGPMISFYGGYFLASWKNGMLSEDTPGQRVLWSYASEADPLSYSTPEVLLPNVSNGEPCLPNSKMPYPPNPHYLSPSCAHLFAEPTAILNGRAYLAASLRQFCLWPLDPLNEGGKYLLLRQVIPTSPPTLGPAFWAKDPGAGFSETNKRLGIRTLAQMPQETRTDISALLLGARPCPKNATKCEFCEDGCQDLREAALGNAPCKLADPGGPWIERTHWRVPGTQEDVLVYRAEGQVLCFSQRSGGNRGNWSAPSSTRLTDIHSNMNAGTLPDGRIYLLHNPILGKTERDPLVLSLSTDGFNFDQAFVALSCRLQPVAPINTSCPNAVSCPHLGCKRRNPGGGSPGPQYLLHPIFAFAMHLSDQKLKSQRSFCMQNTLRCCLCSWLNGCAAQVLARSSA
eukprot:COSAG02_NODE_3474_length_6681_cov_29.310696_6_plen_465_part_00